MIIIAALILLTATLLVLCAAIGVISIIVVIDDHRSRRARACVDRTPTRADATTRRILGVGARNGHEGDR